MDYQELFEKEDDYLIERFELARERVGQLAKEGISSDGFQEYFSSTASFLLQTYRIFDEKLSGNWKKKEKIEEYRKETRVDFIYNLEIWMTFLSST